MQVGFIILAHDNLDRVAALARYLSLHGPVTIHVDNRTTSAPLQDLGANVDVISTQKSAWGSIGLVDATLDAARQLLERNQVGHVCLLSGSCLPIRPTQELCAFLALHPDTDFIETVPAEQTDWVQGGLQIERFRFWYPLSWKTHRWWFNRLVGLQRRIGLRRRLPKGLVPHIGLQWWCLTSTTLRALLDHPQLPEWRRYFAWSWIPDESFFQSLVHQVTPEKARSKPLTLQRFDADGRPFVFHDDHVDVLEDTDYFFARKIDADGEALYSRYLSDTVHRVVACDQFHGSLDEAPFDQARSQSKRGGQGLLSVSKMTSGTTPSHVETIAPYAVIVSRDNDMLRRVRSACFHAEIRFHGHLFGDFPTDFADDFPVIDGLGPGCLPTEPTQRDHRAAQYLAKVLWLGRDRPSAFLFHPKDQRQIRAVLYSDPNARLILLGDPTALLASLSQSLRNRDGRPMRPPVWRAWHRGIENAGEDAVAQALNVLASDWDDDTGWTRPMAGGGR